MKQLEHAFYVFVLAVTLGACATPAELTFEGDQVKIAQANEVSKCQNVGVVMGKGDGEWMGDVADPSELVTDSLVELRNHAAELNATHVVPLGPPQLFRQSRGSTTATVTGTAYRCL